MPESGYKTISSKGNSKCLHQINLAYFKSTIPKLLAEYKKFFLIIAIRIPFQIVGKLSNNMVRVLRLL